MAENDLKRLLEANAAETREHFNAVAADLRQDNVSARKEIRRHFEVTAERLEKKIDLVAEAVAQIDEKIDRELRLSVRA